MHIHKFFLIAAGLAICPAARCSAQFFTPVSTTVNADTGYTASGTSGQGPQDNEDYGVQTGTLPASATFNYTPNNSMLTSSASGTATIDPAGGTINVNLSAMGDGGSTPTGDVAATAVANTTIMFDVPPGSGMYVSLSVTAGAFNDAPSMLTGPDGFSTIASGVNYPSVPAGQYTLQCLASTQIVTGTLFNGNNSSSIQIFPEPEESAAVIAAVTLLPLRRRRSNMAK